MSAALIQIQAPFAPTNISSSPSSLTLLHAHCLSILSPSFTFLGHNSQNSGLLYVHYHKPKPCIRAFSNNGTSAMPMHPSTTSVPTGEKVPLSQYLMERLGFSEKEALTVSKKMSLYREMLRGKEANELISCEKADNVISYLKDRNECGLNLSQIKQIVTKHHKVLMCDIENTLKPKIKFLIQDVGFSTSDLALELSRNPKLYLERDLSPAFQELRCIMGSDEYVVKLFKGLHFGTAANFSKNFIPNVALLKDEYGIPRDKLLKFLTKKPTSFMRKTDWMRDVLVKIEDKWGIRRDSGVFLTAVDAFSGIGDDKINSKCQVLRSFGWSESDILILIRKHPTFVGHSEARTQKALEFYMNELGFKPAYIASRPAMLCYSLGNSVLPRHKVLSVLKEKGLIKEDFQLYSALTLNENKFFGKFILPYENTVPELRQVYIDGRVQQVRRMCTWRHLKTEGKHLLRAAE